MSEALFNYEQNGLSDWLIYRLNRDYLESFHHLIELLSKEQYSLAELRHRKDQLPIQSRDDLAINGHDLIQIFTDKQAGPWMKQMLETIERLVVQRELQNTKNAIKEWILCHPPETN